jgi:membrane-associated phospholipid phosphatase
MCAPKCFPVVPFEHSFASGHEIRAVLLAACLVALRPGFWPLAVAWLAAVSVVLVTGGWHTPTDVLGGLVLAVGVGALALVLARSSRPEAR